MNKSLMTGIGIGVVVAAAAGAVASLSMKDEGAQGAAVERVTPLEEVAAAGTPAQSPAETAEPASTAAGTVAIAAPAATDSTAATRPAAAKSPGRASAGNGAPSFARVIASTPVVETERVAREVCRDEQVVRQKPVQDEKRVAGTALGAIVGGVLGNQVGDGDGQKIATAAGAIAGGVAGSKIQKRVQQGNTETVTEKRCETVYDMKEKTVGWDVRYSIGDQVQSVRMDSDPGVGAQLPLRDGRLTAQTAAKGRGTT
jgi:uncharacterized protein YcfJ